MLKKRFKKGQETINQVKREIEKKERYKWYASSAYRQTQADDDRQRSDIYFLKVLFHSSFFLSFVPIYLTIVSFFLSITKRKYRIQKK